MLLKSQSMSCLLDAEAPVKHQRSPSHGTAIIGKAEIMGSSEHQISLERLPFFMKHHDRETRNCDQDRTPPPALWSQSSKTRGTETIEIVNQELSRRCHELSLQIQALEEESSFDKRYRPITLHGLQCERDNLSHDKQRLLRDCMILEQKLMEINSFPP